VFIDVIPGTVLWEQAFGVASPGATNTPPEVRRYALQQAIHLKQMKLYVRVTDQFGGKIFGVFPLGPLLTFSTPEKQIDKQSRLHVLYQVSARDFYYLIVSPDGKLLVRQVFEYTNTRPTLRADREGNIYVGNGVRRPTRDDIGEVATNAPVATPATATNAPSAAVPTGTNAPATNAPAPAAP